MTTRWGFVDTGHGKRPQAGWRPGKTGNLWSWFGETKYDKSYTFAESSKAPWNSSCTFGIRKATGLRQHISIPNGKSMFEIAQRNYLWSPRFRAPCRLWKQVATSKIHAAPGPYWSIWQKKCAWFVSLAQFFLIVVVGIANGPKESFALKDVFLPGFAHKGFPSNRSCHDQK